MISSTSTFNTYNALPVKNPVFAVKFEELTSPDIYFSTGPFSTTTETVYEYIADYEFSSCTVNLDQAFPGNGTGYITINEDSASRVMTILKNNVIIGKMATIYYGFQEIGLTNFITFKSYFVYDYEIMDNGAQIKFLIEQKNKALDRIYDKSFFPDDTLSGVLADYDYFVRTVTPNISFEYEDNVTSTKEKMFNVNFADIMLAAIISPGGGPGATFESNLYRCLNDGANAYPLYVDAAGIAEQGRRYHNAQSSISGTAGTTYTENDRREKYVVEIAEEQNIKTFLENLADDFFFRFYITSGGKLSGKCISYYQNILEQEDYTIDQDSSQTPTLDTRFDYLFNNLTYNFVDASGNDVTEENDFTFSQTKYDEEYIKEIDSPGFYEELGYSYDITKWQGYKLLDTFGEGITQITIPAVTEHCLVEPFDLIKYSNSYLKSIASVTALSNMPVMVSNVRYSWNSGNPLVTITGFMFDYFLKTGGRLTTIKLSEQTGVTLQEDCGYYDDFSVSVDVGDDAYFALTTGISGYNLLWSKVEITPVSGTASTLSQQIKLGCIVFDSGTSTIVGRNTTNYVFESVGGSQFTTYIPVLIHDTTTAWDYAKLDLYEENHDSSTTYQAPGVELLEVYAFKFRSA